MEATLFDFPKLEITNKIRLIELFGGIGSQAMALRDIGANFEHYRLVEFDKYAVASYNAIHGTNFETSDIRNVHGADLGIVKRETFTYIMTYSFPCTDLSVAGKMQGMSKAEWEQGNSTRSGLLWEVERILKELKANELPQVLLMENVPQVHAEQNKADFEAWLAFLRSRGYFNFYQDLNAKDYGIPQNRERCFCVSILSPDFIDYEFPKPVKLEKVMRDYLEDEVDEKYYIKSEKADKLIAELIERGELPTEQNRTEQNRTEQNRTEQNRTEQNRTSVPDDEEQVNHTPVELCDEQSRVQTQARMDGYSLHSPGERLQGTCQLRKNERSNRMVRQLGFIEQGTGKQMEAVLLSAQGKRFEKRTDIATTLMARDYKGFGNQASNGVIEWQR